MYQASVAIIPPGPTRNSCEVLHPILALLDGPRGGVMQRATCRDDDFERIHHLVRHILDENGIEHSSLMIKPVDLHVSGAVHADITIELAKARKVSVRVCVTAFDTPAALARRIARQLKPE